MHNLCLPRRLVDQEHPDVQIALTKSQVVANWGADKPLNEIAYQREPSDMEKLFKTVRTAVRNTRYNENKEKSELLKKEAKAKEAGKFAKKRLLALDKADDLAPRSSRRLRGDQRSRSSAMHPWQQEPTTAPIPLSLLNLNQNRDNSDSGELAAAKVLQFEKMENNPDGKEFARVTAMQERLSIHRRPRVAAKLQRAPKMIRRMSTQSLLASYRSQINPTAPSRLDPPRQSLSSPGRSSSSSPYAAPSKKRASATRQLSKLRERSSLKERKSFKKEGSSPQAGESN